MKWGRIGLGLVGLWLLTSTASAQDASVAEASGDDAARVQFQRGQEAFEDARYEEALDFFWQAYGTSRKGELLYDIGLTADRLQRDEEALEAFRRYLAETENPVRRVEVERRVAALEMAIAVHEASTAALEEAEMRYDSLAKSNAAELAAAERKRRSALVGGSVLLAAGAVGVGAMTWGLLKGGSCDERAGGAETCVGEQSTSSWAWVYGGAGAAAMVGGLTWMVIGGKRVGSTETRLSFSPTGVSVRGRF